MGGARATCGRVRSLVGCPGRNEVREARVEGRGRCAGAGGTEGEARGARGTNALQPGPPPHACTAAILPPPAIVVLTASPPSVCVQFGKWHGISSLVNLVSFCVAVSHGWYLASLLTI